MRVEGSPLSMEAKAPFPACHSGHGRCSGLHVLPMFTVILRQ